MTEEVDSEIGNVKINKKTRLILFLVTGAILGLVIYFNYDGFKKPGALSQLLCKVAFVSSFFGVFNCLFPSSEKKTHSKKRTLYVAFYSLLALSFLFIPIAERLYNSNSGAFDAFQFTRYQFLFSENKFGIFTTPSIKIIVLQISVLFVVGCFFDQPSMVHKIPKIKFSKFTLLEKASFKHLGFIVLVVAIIMPVLFAPHEYQHKTNQRYYYTSKYDAISKPLITGQLMIFYQPLFTNPDPKISIGWQSRTTSNYNDNLYVYYNKLRIDLLLVYWLLIVLLSGATFFATRQKRVGN